MLLELVVAKGSSDEEVDEEDLISLLKKLMPTKKEIERKSKYLIYSPLIEDKTDEASNGGVEVFK